MGLAICASIAQVPVQLLPGEYVYIEMFASYYFMIPEGQNYMVKYKFNQSYKSTELSNSAALEYVSIEVIASNSSTPQETLSEKRPSGGGPILRETSPEIACQRHVSLGHHSIW